MLNFLVHHGISFTSIFCCGASRQVNKLLVCVAGPVFAQVQTQPIHANLLLQLYVRPNRDIHEHAAVKIFGPLVFII